jgi:hypothetical protein
VAAPRLKYQITLIVKTWTDPDDHDQGLEVATHHDYAYTAEEAVVLIKRMARQIPDAVQVLGFYTKVTMVEQFLGEGPNKTPEK